jgi:hypothetical protein
VRSASSRLEIVGYTRARIALMRLGGRTALIPLLVAAVAAAGCGKTTKPILVPTLKQLAVHRFNAWWWTDERAAYLLEANARSALHDAPQYSNWHVRRAECTGTGATTRYRARKPLSQQFVCTVQTFAGQSGTTNGPTLTVRVIALTQDYFDLDVQTGK